MSFLTWLAIAIAIASGVIFANQKKKPGKKEYIGLVLFLIGVVLFLIGWFNK